MGKKFTEDFKQMIVELYQAGTPVAELASEYGISTQTVYKWVKLHASNEQSGMTQADYIKLKKQMAKLQEENAILKKALTIFAQK